MARGTRFLDRLVCDGERKIVFQSESYGAREYSRRTSTIFVLLIGQLREVSMVRRVHAIAAGLAMTTHSALAEAQPDTRLVGLWSANSFFLELNVDGTFFAAEQTPEDDLFGTYGVRDSAITFTFTKDGKSVSSRKSIYSEGGNPNRMELVDEFGNSLRYYRVR